MKKCGCESTKDYNTGERGRFVAECCEAKKKETPCESPKISVRRIAPVCFDWVMRLTGAMKGKLVVSSGKCLSFLSGVCGDMVIFDSKTKEVKVGYQPDRAKHTRTDDSVLEQGHIPLVKLAKSFCPNPENPEELLEQQIAEHGFQELGLTDSGEMLAATVDCNTGELRFDVLDPPLEYPTSDQCPRALVYEVEEVDQGANSETLNDCNRTQTRKRWFNVPVAIQHPGDFKWSGQLGPHSGWIPATGGRVDLDIYPDYKAFAEEMAEIYGWDISDGMAPTPDMRGRYAQGIDYSLVCDPDGNERDTVDGGKGNEIWSSQKYAQLSSSSPVTTYTFTRQSVRSVADGSAGGPIRYPFTAAEATTTCDDGSETCSTSTAVDADPCDETCGLNIGCSVRGNNVAFNGFVYVGCKAC